MMTTRTPLGHHVPFPQVITARMHGLVLLLLVACTCGQQPVPLWKMQLTNFQNWRGTYIYKETGYTFNLSIHSVQPDNNGVAFLTFQANNTHFDMSAFSTDDILVTFKREAAFRFSEHFFGSDDFRFVAKLVSTGDYYYFTGNITQPDDPDFSGIYFLPKGSNSDSLNLYKVTGSSALSVGLPVGISLALLVICITIAIVILRWGVRNGYLRHVALSYKLFRNPQDPVTFSSGQCHQKSEGNVHI